MSVILLSLLLVILVGLGGLMARSTAEYFDNPPSAMDVGVVQVSPALANLLETPQLVAKMNGMPPAQVDPLKREQEAIAAASQAEDDDDSDDDKPKKRKSLKEQRCPKCPKCPDMSKYVRLDEVPCWNCTLP